MDGRCNNLDNPTWGSTLTSFKRRIPADYADGEYIKLHVRKF